MPSNAYLNFLHIRIDALKLIAAYSYYKSNGIGGTSLGFFTRSGIMMLCAAWERYNEDLLLESVENVCMHLTDINNLSREIKLTLSRKIKNDAHDLSPIRMGGEGWKDVWRYYAKMETEKLNTPKVANLNNLFNRFMGISNYSGHWNLSDVSDIDRFVSDRGEIAHNGNKSSNIRMSKLRTYQEMIIDKVINIDSEMADEIQRICGHASLPWVKDYSKNYSYYT